MKTASTQLVFIALLDLVARSATQVPDIDPITLKPVEPANVKPEGHLSGSVYRVGGDVKPPKAISAPDPEYSKQARKAKYKGTVVLWMIVGADGIPRDIAVSRSLGMGLDEKAIEAVRKWRFQPATKHGVPVAVQIILDFKLY